MNPKLGRTIERHRECPHAGGRLPGGQGGPEHQSNDRAHPGRRLQPVLRRRCGTVARRAGVGSDWKLADNLFVGAEATWRDLDVQYFVGDEEAVTNWQEQTHRLYGYWAPFDRMALTGELVYDRFEAQNSELTEGSTVPEKLTTYSIPLGIRYFDPRGFFASFGATFVRQDLDRARNDALEIGDGDQLLHAVRRAGRLPVAEALRPRYASGQQHLRPTLRLPGRQLSREPGLHRPSGPTCPTGR